MAEPTISYNTSTGSDSNSGSGGTALTGSAATTSGLSTTVSLDGSPDLSGVATDGSACLRLDNHGFYKITAVDNSAKTVTVSTALDIRAAGRGWGIGGKLATITGTEPRKLWQATAAGVADDSGTGGAQGGWTVILEDNQSINTSSLSIAFTAGTGILVVKSNSSTIRSITQTTNAVNCLSVSSTGYIRFENIQLLHSAATTNKRAGVTTSVSSHMHFKRCAFGELAGTNSPQFGITRSAGNPTVFLENCAVLSTYSHGLDGTLAVTAVGCVIAGCGTSGTGNGFEGHAPSLIDCIVARCAGSGVNSSSTSAIPFFSGTIFDSNGAAGAVVRADTITQGFTVQNCIFSNNGTYGLSLTGTTPHYPFDRYNLYYNNTTAAVNGFTMSSDSISGSNPNFINNASNVLNFGTTGSPCASAGFPFSTETMGAGLSGTTSYRDIGVQQQPTSGGPVALIGPGPLVRN